METTTVSITTGRIRGLFDLTHHVARFVAGRGDGLISVFVPHATAGVAVVELGAGSEEDVMAAIDATLPRRDERYRHRHGSPGHGADHVLPALVSPSIVIPVLDGSPALGAWQSIVLVDPNVDNHTRTVRFSFLPG